MGNNRNDFTAKTKNLLCVSTCAHCSICGTCTTWVDENAIKKENIGEADHIEAAAEGGPRYNPNQTDEQRASFENGIWLCSNCHTEIDSNEDDYTVELLHIYKDKAKEKARLNIYKSLQGQGLVQPQDFIRAMISFFSMLYGNRESLHNFITEIKKYVDDFFDSYLSDTSFYTEYAFGVTPLIKDISKIRVLWLELLPNLAEKIKKGRLYIPDEIFHLEKKYFDIIGICPCCDEEWWNFFNQIKDHFEELEEMNTKLLNEYKKQYDSFRADI